METFILVFGPGQLKEFNATKKAAIKYKESTIWAPVRAAITTGPGCLLCFRERQGLQWNSKPETIEKCRSFNIKVADENFIDFRMGTHDEAFERFRLEVGLRIPSVGRLLPIGSNFAKAVPLP